MATEDDALTAHHQELDSIRSEARACQRCDLWQGRTQVVVGEGNPHAEILLIGEAPGDNEDRTGRPFVGRAGQLLDAALVDAGLVREAVYITNVVRCRPTTVSNASVSNRAPRAGEIAACAPWRWLELNLVDPKVVVCIGAPAAKALIDKKFKITEQRGQIFSGEDGRSYIATLHPAYLLRLMSADREAYFRVRADLVSDLKVALRAAGRVGTQSSG